MMNANSQMKAMMYAAKISMVRALVGDEAALVAARFNLTLATEILTFGGDVDDETCHAQHLAGQAISAIDAGRLADALVFVKRAPC